MQYTCLSIAGFDPSGGAGVQADLKTFSATGSYGMTVLTALPIQNTCGVRNCYNIPLDCIKQQLDTIFDDIIPDSIKIGMLFSVDIIELVADFLTQYAKNIPIVLDPVMIAKSGDPLLEPNAIDALKRKAIPLASIITPNLPEAYTLIGKKMDPQLTAMRLLDLGCNAVLLKGGHENKITADDIFLDQKGHLHVLSAKRIDSKNTHGTGCTLSAAICSYLAQGASLVEACKLAKSYLSAAIAAAKDQNIGKGNGPVHHFYHWWSNQSDFTKISPEKKQYNSIK